MTELSRQLSRATGKTGTPGSLMKVSGLRSFLFTPTEAQKYTNESIYDMGVNGLIELSSAEPRFSSFSDTVFSRTLRDTPPERRTESDLSRTDDEIEKLCHALCGHFLSSGTSRAAHRVIEHLLRNFKAYARPKCVDALIACALPYHETREFARLLPVLALDGRWAWLRALARSGSPMSRESYVAQCRADTSLMQWTVSAAVGARDAGWLSRQFANFVGAVCMEVVVERRKRKVSHTMLQAMVPMVSKGLKKSGHLRVLGYALVAGLANSETEIMGLGLPELLFAATVKAGDARDKGEVDRLCAMAAVQLCATGKASITKECAKRMIANAAGWISRLAELEGQGYDVSTLSGMLAVAMARHPETEGAWSGLGELLARVSVSDSTAEMLAEKALEAFGKVPSDCMKAVLSRLASKHPEKLDEAVNKFVSSSRSEESMALLSELFAGSAHEAIPGVGVLSIALHDVQPSCRLASLCRISELVAEGRDESEMETSQHELFLAFVQRELCARLTDDDQDVALEAVKVASLLPIAMASSLREPLLALVRKSSASGAARILRPALKLLFAEASQSRDAELVSQLVSLVWPHLLPQSGSEYNDCDASFVAEACAHHDLSPLFAVLPRTEQSLCHDVLESLAKAISDIHEKFLPLLARLYSLPDPRGLILSLVTLLSSLKRLQTKAAARRRSSVSSGVACPVPVLPQLHSVLRTVLSIVLPRVANKPAPEDSDMAVDSGTESLLALPRDSPVGLSSLFSSLESALESSTVSPDDSSLQEIFRVLAGSALTNPRVHRLTKLVLTKFFPDLPARLQFLSRCVLRSDAMLQIRCCNLCSVLVRSSDDITTLSEALRSLVPALLWPLQSQQRWVRNASLATFSVLASRGSKDQPLISLVRALTAKRDELLSEPAFLRGLCSQLCETGAVDAFQMTKPHVVASSRIIAEFVSSLHALPDPPRDVESSLAFAAAALCSSEALLALAPLVFSKDDPSFVSLLQPLFVPTSADLLNSDVGKPIWKSFVALLDCSESVASRQQAALGVVQVPLWTSLSPVRRESLLNALVDLLVRGTPEQRAAAEETIRPLTLDAPLVRSLLEIRPVEENYSEEDEFARINEVLELLRTRGSDVALCEPLVRDVFSVLRLVVDRAGTAKDSLTRDYTIQLALRALTVITSSLAQNQRDKAGKTAAAPKSEGVAGMPPAVLSSKQKRASLLRPIEEPSRLESSYDVDLVTRCMQTVRNPQVHVDALLLLSSVSKLLPGLVLRHIVPIFTCVVTSAASNSPLEAGSSQGVNASAVLRETIESIVPPLVASAGMSGPAPLVRRLVEGFRQIPGHRRLELFASVVSAISAERLGLVLISLFSFSASSGVDDDSTHEFAHSLCLEFDPLPVLVSLLELARFSLAAATAKTVASLGQEWAQFCVCEEGVKDALRKASETALVFIGRHVGSRVFVESVVSLPSKIEQTAAQTSLTDLFEVGVEAAAKSTTCFSETNTPMLRSITESMDFKTFIAAVSKVLRSPVEDLWETALIMLNDRLEAIAPTISATERDILLKDTGLFTGLLDPLLHSSSSSSRKNALCTLEILVRNLGRFDPDRFSQLMSCVVERLHDPVEDVSSSALMCAAGFVSEIGANCLQHIPQVVPFALKRIRACLAEGPTSRNLAPTLSYLACIVEKMPALLTKYCPEIISLLLHPTLVSNGDSPTPACAHSAQILRSLTENLEPRVLLAPIFQVYTDKEAASLISLRRLLEVVKEVVAKVQPDRIRAFTKDLSRFFVREAFDFRAKYGDMLSVTELDDLEADVIAAFVQFVLKLNEIAFKPLLLHVCDRFVKASARGQDGEGEVLTEQQRDSALFFVRILKALAENLRGIFSPFFTVFADYLLAHLRASDTTVANAAAQRERAGSKKRGRAEANVVHVEESECLLKCCILDTLGLCFTHDTQGVVVNGCFEAVADVLCAQLDCNASMTPENFATLAEDHLVPCLGHLAGGVTERKREHWASLDHRIIQHTDLRTGRHDEKPAHVVRCAFRCLTEIWRRAGEDIAEVLPEVLQPLKENLEASDPDLKDAVDEFAAIVQSYLGDRSLRDSLS